MKNTNVTCNIYWSYSRYHGDERLLPEYSDEMSDQVKVVEEPISPSGSTSDAEILQKSNSIFFSDDEKSDSSSSGFSYVDEPSPFFVEDDEGGHPITRNMYLATLKLNKVRPEQKGMYKCGPSNTKSASVELHITDGEW